MRPGELPHCGRGRILRRFPRTGKHVNALMPATATSGRHFDVVIIGAGAAGMMCAATAGRRGRSVLLLDHATRLAEKIRISGGGRCNFTNLGIAADRFLSKNPRFALSALKRYTQWDFIARMDAAGIAWHEKTLGQLFCDGSAKDVVALLTGDLAAAGGELWLSCALGAVRREGAGFGTGGGVSASRAVKSSAMPATLSVPSAERSWVTPFTRLLSSETAR